MYPEPGKTIDQKISAMVMRGQYPLAKRSNVLSTSLLQIFLIDTVQARFAAKLETAGLKLQIPNNKPNLAIILGGAGTSLESLVSSYTALAKKGQSTTLKFLKGTKKLTQQKNAFSSRKKVLG